MVKEFRSVSNQQYLPPVFFSTSFTWQSPSSPFKTQFRHPLSLPSPPFSLNPADNSHYDLSTLSSKFLDYGICHMCHIMCLWVCLPHRPWTTGGEGLRNPSTVSWYTVDAQFVLVEWLTVAGQAISLSGLSFLVVTAFPRRLDESQPRVAVICCLARGLRLCSGRLDR